jgi:hypothetical protein
MFPIYQSQDWHDRAVTVILKQLTSALRKKERAIFIKGLLSSFLLLPAPTCSHQQTRGKQINNQPAPANYADV